MTDRHLTTVEAARFAYCSHHTLVRCFDRGLIGGFKIPGSRVRRIPVAALRAFLVANGIPTDALDRWREGATP